MTCLRSLSVLSILVIPHLALGAPDAGADLVDTLLDMPVAPRDWRPFVPSSRTEACEPPADDAPRAALVAYWSDRHHDSSMPSAKVRERLLAAAEEDSDLLSDLVAVLPDGPKEQKRVKAVLDSKRGGCEEAKNWLMLRGPWFRDELITFARNVSFDPKYGSFRNDRHLQALASLDSAAAEPILRGLETGSVPQLRALATVARYQASVKKGVVGTALQDRLVLIARDPREAPTARALAIEALLASPWKDRDEFFLSLIRDPSALVMVEGQGFRMPLVEALQADPDHWVALLAPHVGSPDRPMHDGAVFLLSDVARADALKPLLPWLADPAWSSADKLVEGIGDSSWRILSGYSSSRRPKPRADFLRHASSLKLPETIPALLKALDTGTAAEFEAAALGLTSFRDPRVVQALRDAYPRVSPFHRTEILVALAEQDGLDLDWSVKAIEAAAAKSLRFDLDPSPLEAAGHWLSGRPTVPEDLVERVLARARELDASEPAKAQQLRKIAAGWPSASSTNSLLERLVAGTISADEARALVTEQKEGLGTRSERFERAARAGGVSAGFAAVLGGSVGVSGGVLDIDDVETLRAALAAARLAKAPLPLQKLARLLRHPDGRVVRAASRYLEAEDSPEARRLLRDANPGKFLVFGSRGSWDPGHFSFEQLGSTEARMRDELSRPDGPDAVFGLSFGGYWALPGNISVRVSGDKAEVVAQFDPAVYGHRALSAAELARLRKFIAEEHVERLAPLTTQVWDGTQQEFFWLDRSGGYRVFMNNPGIAEGKSSVYARLSQMFLRLAEEAPTEKIFLVSKSIPGIRLLASPQSDRGPQIEAVWAAGSDVRVVMSSRDDSGPAKQAWHTFSKGKVGSASARPDVYPPPLLPCRDEDPYRQPSWMSGLHDLRLGADREGLRLCRKGAEPIRLGADKYLNPVVSLDGRWAMASRTTTNWGDPNDVVLVDLPRRELFDVDLPKAEELAPVAFVPAHGKFLLYRGKAHPAQWAIGTAESPEPPELYLFDPVTRKSELVTGEFRPLLSQDARPLQPTGRPDEFWAAMPVTEWTDVEKGTVLGRYDSRRFTFTPVATFPNLQFSSTDLWVDQGLVYLAYRGYLLTLPLPK